MALLEARGLTKRFGGIAALSEVSLDVDEAELVGLVGPNGAGKTTLFNCLLGATRPTSGRVVFAGRDLGSLATYRRARLGIGRTFQRLELFAGLTVADHLLVAERARRGDGGLARDLLGRGGPKRDELARVAETLARLGLAELADAPVESLPLGRGRLVELGRALIGEPRLLLLDEPSSGLDRAESAALASVLSRVREQQRVAVLLVEHDLELVRSLADRLYVIDSGSVIGAGPPDRVLADPAVRQAYLGLAS